MPKPSKSQKLRQELSKPTLLSREEAELRLPDLVTAELQGEDVAALYADVLEAIGRYPDLAEEYEQLLDDASFVRDDPAMAQPSPQPNPWLATSPMRMTERYSMHRVGNDIGDFLMNVVLPPIEGFATMRGLDLAQVMLPELPGKPALSVRLRAFPGALWQLSVRIDADNAQGWRISAIVDGASLRSERQGDASWSFAPAFPYPQTSLVILFQGPDSSDE